MESAPIPGRPENAAVRSLTDSKLGHLLRSSAIFPQQLGIGVIALTRALSQDCKAPILEGSQPCPKARP